MDMFMDKLAQKLTAQEIIKANTAADVEELNKLKNQIAEYNECLAKLQKLIDDGAGKLAGIQIEESELAHLVGESYGRMKMLQQDVENLQGTIEQQQERIDGMEKSAAVRMEAMSASVLNQLEALASQTEVLSATVGAKIDQLCGQLEAQATGGLSEVEENVHKECVKVYRNVQAVMVEESGKQNEAMDGAKADVEAVKGKLGAVLGVSVAAAVLSLAGVLYQVLSGLHVLPF